MHARSILVCHRRPLTAVALPSWRWVFAISLLVLCPVSRGQSRGQATSQAIGWVDSPKGEGKWYAHWGYHRAEYGRTNLRLVGPGIDLTFHDIKATDMPAPFDPKVHLNPAAFTIPQFNARIGRKIKDGTTFPGALWISAGWDHLKYKIPHALHEVSGYIDQSTYDLEPFDWNWRDYNFEHSDGMNFVRIAAERDWTFGKAARTRQTWDTANQRLRWGIQTAASLGLVLCATDVRWEGIRTKHYWSITGWGLSTSVGAWVQWGRLRVMARAQAGGLNISNSRFLASNDLSGETPITVGAEADLLDASYARHAMTFLEKGVTLAYTFGRKGGKAADERIRIAPSR
jgi:hypothetical protein